MIKEDADTIWYQRDENHKAEPICTKDSRMYTELLRYFNDETFKDSPVGNVTFHEESYRKGFMDGWKIGRSV